MLAYTQDQFVVVCGFFCIIISNFLFFIGVHYQDQPASPYKRWTHFFKAILKLTIHPAFPTLIRILLMNWKLIHETVREREKENEEKKYRKDLLTWAPFTSYFAVFFLLTFEPSTLSLGMFYAQVNILCACKGHVQHWSTQNARYLVCRVNGSYISYRQRFRVIYLTRQSLRHTHSISCSNGWIFMIEAGACWIQSLKKLRRVRFVQILNYWNNDDDGGDVEQKEEINKEKY